MTRFVKAYTLLIDMIKEGKKIQVDDISNVLSEAIDILSKDTDIICLYAFGSLASATLKPLSDLDFGVLLSYRLDRMERFRRHLDLIGILNRIFKTDEIDLILMNDAPIRFSYNIIKNGRILFCRDKLALIDFHNKTIMQHLDFKYIRESFDRYFLKKAGYYG
ncbi:nucleotidyltransferase domain-containing protein [bacterium]|nr:nucleotidyltransferase domain-containing protein [bacterium]